VWADGRREVFVSAEAVGSADAFASLSGGVLAPSLVLRDLDQVEDPDVRDALYWYGRPASSYSLWKAFEAIRASVGSLETRGLATKSEVDRFGEGLNQPDASGRDARHARPTRPSRPMSGSPMSISEAEEFIGRVLRDWLDAQPGNGDAGSPRAS
jgi:hypothetical protein